MKTSSLILNRQHRKEYGQEGGPKGLEELVEHFKEVNGETNWGKWEVDQVLSSFAIFLFFVAGFSFHKN